MTLRADRDLVKNEINGYVIEENDIMTMANCIFTLYHDDEKRKVFEYNAFESFKSNYCYFQFSVNLR